jgi:hypothetical protein
MAPPISQDELLEDLRRQTAATEAVRERARAEAAAARPPLGSVTNACLAGAWGTLVYVGWTLLLGLVVAFGLVFFLGGLTTLMLMTGIVGILVNAGITAFAAVKGARSALANCGGRWGVTGVVFVGCIGALNVGIGVVLGPQLVDSAAMLTAMVAGTLYVIGWAWLRGDDE